MRFQEIQEACWTGYRQAGMKKKGDRQVPNCVPVEEVKTGPEITGKDLLFKAAAMAMRDASHEGISLDYEQAIKQASKIYGIPYQPSELPRLLAQRAEIDRQLALLKQGKQVAKLRRQAKLAPTPAGADEYWKTHALPTDRIKPATKSLEETEAELAEDLKKWFKEKWVRFGPDGKIRGDCARGSSKEGKPKCLPQSKAHALGKKGRASSAAKKRREDPNPERRGAAKNVATKVKEDELNEVWELLNEPAVQLGAFLGLLWGWLSGTYKKDWTKAKRDLETQGTVNNPVYKVYVNGKEIGNKLLTRKQTFSLIKQLASKEHDPETHYTIFNTNVYNTTI
jgi:hypothetical protein